MFRSYWIIAIALGLVAISSLGQAQEESGSANREAQAQNDPTKPLWPPIRVEVIEDDAKIEAAERREKEASEREIRDLAAQEGMNSATQAMKRATEDMRNYSLVSTVLVGVGTVLLVVTLYYTRQANKAARDAVVVTREIGKRQLRAYLSFKDTKIHEVGFDQYPIATIEVVNQGTTPIFITDNRSMIALHHFPNFGDIQYPDPDESARFVIAPGQKTTMRPRLKDLITVDQSIGLGEGRYIIFVHGRIEFRDVFGEHHWMTYRMKYGGDAKASDSKNDLAWCEEGNDASYFHETS